MLQHRTAVASEDGEALKPRSPLGAVIAERDPLVLASPFPFAPSALASLPPPLSCRFHLSMGGKRRLPPVRRGSPPLVPFLALVNNELA